MTTTIHSADPDKLANAVQPEKSKEDLGDYADEAVEKAQQLATETQEAVTVAAQEAVGEAREALLTASDAAHKFAKEQPIATAAGALAVGVAIGMALNARR